MLNSCICSLTQLGFRTKNRHDLRHHADRTAVDVVAATVMVTCEEFVFGLSHFIIKTVNFKVSEAPCTRGHSPPLPTGTARAAVMSTAAVYWASEPKTSST